MDQNTEKDEIKDTIDELRILVIKCHSVWDKLENKLEWITNEQKNELNYSLLSLTTRLKIYFYAETLKLSKESLEKQLLNNLRKDSNFLKVLKRYTNNPTSQNLSKILEQYNKG